MPSVSKHSLTRSGMSHCCLDPIWHAGALRMVDIRADTHDREPETQRRRGYNDQGYPLCPHGYVLRPNGHDYDRRRTKWCCEKGCPYRRYPARFNRCESPERRC